ncbi:LysM peptidoglycan-binding domain-containing protein [Kitasatospora sp. NPDC057541]|uniref:LysM peptidoglycan-binding domain-containing protein n=1 Tax=unclassified Kitasatospora TaxID=2633591 RepID=UPI0036D20506
MTPTPPRTSSTPDDPFAALPASSSYPLTSRYHGVPVALYTAPDGRQVPYLTRRLLPPTDGLTPLAEHTVGAGDRLDLLAQRYLGGADQWWRIADANPAIDPRELTSTPGRRITVALPGAVPGVGRA